ncbi:MAG: hypothetical protein WDW38_003841 [Sanguina aurantia]
MVLSTRPDWTRGTTGIPIDAIVRLHPGVAGVRQDITASRNRVSVLRPGALQPKPEDEYDVSYCYGPESSNADLVARSLAPLIHKMVEGYNVAVIVTGATGTGKTSTLEGRRGLESTNGGGGGGGGGGGEGDGLVHLAIDELFRQLGDKAVGVGVYEDEAEGFQVAGLTMRMAKNSEEMRASFNKGRASRDAAMTDIGSAHERCAALFTVHLAQYAPAALAGEEDRVIVSKLMFVDSPGAERLAMDPEVPAVAGGGLCVMHRGFSWSKVAVAGIVLRLREGVQLNEVRTGIIQCPGHLYQKRVCMHVQRRGLLTTHSALRALATQGSAQFVDYEGSLMTRLLADALGGNCLTLMVGCVRPNQWQESITTLKQLALGQQSHNFPIINHGRARGLLQKLRHRLVAVAEERSVLREQLDESPPEGDPNAIAVSIAKVRDLEARLLSEREEKATLLEEKQALAAEADEAAGRRQRRPEGEGGRAGGADPQRGAAAGAGQDAHRLPGVRVLRCCLSGEVCACRYVRAEDHAAVAEERDALNSEVLRLEDEVSRKVAALDDSQAEVTALRAELRQLHTDMNASLSAKPGGERPQPEPQAKAKRTRRPRSVQPSPGPPSQAHRSKREDLGDPEEGDWVPSGREAAAAAAAAADGKRAALQQQLKLRSGGRRHTPPPHRHARCRVLDDTRHPSTDSHARCRVLDNTRHPSTDSHAAVCPSEERSPQTLHRLLARPRVADPQPGGACAERKLAEAAAESGEARGELARVRAERMLEVTGVEEAREGYRRRLETLMRDVGDMSRAVAIMEVDGSTSLRVTPEALFNTFLRLTDEAVKVTDDREGEMRADLDGLSSRHVALKRKFKSLYLAYRMLRYSLSDSWPPGAGTRPGWRARRRSWEARWRAS